MSLFFACAFADWTASSGLMPIALACSRIICNCIGSILASPVFLSNLACSPNIFPIRSYSASGSDNASYIISIGFPPNIAPAPPSICNCAEPSIAPSIEPNFSATLATSCKLSLILWDIMVILEIPSTPFLNDILLARDMFFTNASLAFTVSNPLLTALA